jgi:hypothetical protein
MSNQTTKNIIFNRKGWLLWGCLFYFFSSAQLIAQMQVKDKARIEKIGVVRGKVLEYNAAGDFVFLRTTGDTLIVDADRVMNTKIIHSLKMPVRGMFWHSAEFGLDFGKSNQWNPVSPYLYLETNHAYVVNRFLQPGIGVGYQQAGDFRIMPVFLSLTGDLYRSRITPFYFSNVGYGLGWARSNDWGNYDKVRGGFLWHIGGGLKIAGRNNAVYLKSGYKIQNIYSEASIPNWWGTTGGFEKIARTIRRVYFGVSMAF